MSLAAGSRLGPYEIVSLLGAGGMGEVYRARDTRLKREVALKVLATPVAAEPALVARFQREAEILAALNHPHIAQVYGVEEASTTTALVMELVEGEDLSDRITGGPMPLGEALAVAKQIVDALEAAHEQGIVHRDLKPANIKVRPDGQVKVLDFGLAKLAAVESRPTAEAGRHPAHSPTVTGAGMMTRPGMILGTAAYMSPEQARGDPVDKRTDIWAFGCVLYELLTGRRAFGRRTLTDTLTAVLHSAPDWAVLPQSTPRYVRRVLERCLVKDQRNRIRDMGDVRLELASLPDSEDSVHDTSRPSARPLFLSLIVGALLGGAVAWGLTPSHPRDRTRFTLTLQPPDSFGPAPAFALSPDGTRIAYVHIRAGTPLLFVRELTQFDSTLLPGSEGAQQPFFSPDGRSIGFFAQGKLKRVAVGGGAPVTLADAGAPRGGSWGTKDTIVFAPTAASPLLEVSASGGPAHAVTSLDRDRGEGGHRWPDYLPDGKTVVFAAGPSTTNTWWSEARICWVALDTGRRVDLATRGTYPRYANGRLYYVENATLLARSLEPTRPAAEAESVTVLERVAQGGGGSSQVALAGNGTVAYASGMPQAPAPLVWVHRSGAEEVLSIAPGVYTTPRLSPDGRRIALTASTDNSDIWVYDIVRATSTRLTFDGGNLWPVWTPDGTRIAFSSNRQGSSSLFWTRPDGDRTIEQLTRTDTIHAATSWSPGGDVLLLMSVDAASNTDILALNRQTGELHPFLQTPFAERQPMFSRDGRLVAYVSNDSGRDEVFVRTFPDGERRWQISNDGGIEPVWAVSGRELFYRRSDDMMVVDVTMRPVFTPGKPRRLFTGRYVIAQPAGYDVSSDGARFLMIKDTSATPLREVRIALNWAQDE